MITSRRFLPLLRSTGFLLGLAVFVGIAGWVLTPKGRDYGWGLENPRIWAFQAEEENSLDVLAIGDSLLMCGYSPLDVWRQEGYTGFNDCTGNQRLTQSLRMLEAFCVTQNPRVVLLEADSLYQPIEVKDVFRDRVYPLIPVLEYHNNWKIFSGKRFLRRMDYNFRHFQMGTHFLYDRELEVPENADTYMEDLGEREEIARVNRFYFGKIASYCRENGIRLVLVSVPSPSLWSYARHSSTHELSDHWDIDYLDMNLLREEVPIDWRWDKSTEGDHLNHRGTRKVSCYLGEYLSSTGLLSDRRGEALARQWDERVRKQQEKIDHHSAGQS